jgi:flagellar hook assembly protein FlgD
MDATELVNSSTARVSLLASQGKLIQDVMMASVFTPNGDGINDELSVRFALLKVLQERPLGVAFYDLSGRLLGQGHGVATTGKAGEQIFTWDGRDLDGHAVAPGIYLCRIEVEADDRDNHLTRLVHIAY